MAGYGTDERFEDWLTENGHATLDAGSLTSAMLRQRGSAYLDGTYEARLPGYRTAGFDQERAWPRTGATVARQPIPTDTIPLAWEHASYAAALYEAQNPGGLNVATSQARAVKRKKIDVIETEFFEGSGNAVADATIRLTVVEGLVAPFLLPETTGAALGLWAVG